MTPTWYDILGLSPDATPDQIKAAWRDATDKFEPGTGGSQFRMFNEAADVFLDPAKRAAYDAGLGLETPAPPAPATPAPSPDVEPVETPAPPAPSPDVEPVETPAPTSLAKDLPDVEPVETPAPPAPSPDVEPAATPALARVAAAVSSIFGLATLSVLVIASVVLAGFLAGALNHRVDHAADSADSYSAGLGAEASSVAERAVTAVLSYDYRTMTTDRAESIRFMTPSYQKTYEKIFDALINGTTAAPGGAVKTKAVVTASVLSTGVVSAQRDQVKVLIFVNQNPVLDGKPGQVLANRVVATMVRRNGAWLLDNLDPLSAGF